LEFIRWLAPEDKCNLLFEGPNPESPYVGDYNIHRGSDLRKKEWTSALPVTTTSTIEQGKTYCRQKNWSAGMVFGKIISYGAIEIDDAVQAYYHRALCEFRLGRLEEVQDDARNVSKAKMFLSI
jgi:hypothetical protein